MSEMVTYQVSNDCADNASTSQWQAAALNNLGLAVLGNVFCGNDNLGVVWIGDQIHGSAHALEDLAGNHVIGQVAGSTDLKSL